MNKKIILIAALVLWFGHYANAADCFRCNGRGQMNCSVCSGKGVQWADCYGCKGSGQQNTTRGTKVCDVCYGRGHPKCPKCYGSGRMDCGACRGSGQR